MEDTSPRSKPEHHLHSPSQPIVGTRKGGPSVDYSPEVMQRLPDEVLQENHSSGSIAGVRGTGAVGAGIVDAKLGQRPDRDTPAPFSGKCFCLFSRLVQLILHCSQ